MLKFSKISTKIRGILTVIVLTILTFAITSCTKKEANTVAFDENYLTVGNYKVSKGEVWDELQWSASALFDNKAKEAIVKEELDDIKAVMSDTKNENYETYASRLQNYLVEAVYGFSFSLEDHQEELDDLDEKDKSTKIKQYADNIYKNYQVSLSREQIIEYLENNDFDALKPLYEIYYLNYAQEKFASKKLDEEIKEKNEEHEKDDKEDTIGYFTKSEIVSKYKSDYLDQGDSEVIAIEFASENEVAQTLLAFGIKVKNGNELCFLTNTENMSSSEFKKYYNEFDFNEASEEDYTSIGGDSHAAILQLYIAMYNYIYTYRDNKIENIGVNQANILDQRQTTQSIIDLYDNLGLQGSEEDEKRLEEVLKPIRENEKTKDLITYTAKQAQDIDSTFYDLIYSTLSTPKEDEEDYKRWTTDSKSIGDKYYLVYKIDQKEEHVDKLYTKDINEDDLYDNIKKDETLLDNDETLYTNIITDLTNEDLTQDYISSKITEALKDVKVKIFDKEIEISYSKDHADYTKTLSGAPDNNTVAEFKYNDTVIKFELTNEENEGLWDILEYRHGTTTAVSLIETKMIKDTEEYKEIDEHQVDLYYQSIEYILASFANDIMASQGYPASLGKYNFLMLYYHTADIDSVVDDILKVNSAKVKLLTDYSSDKLAEFFSDYTKKAYDNFFNISSTQVSIFLDNDEDGKPDDINEWKNKKVEFEGTKTTLKNVALELYNEIYNQILSDTADHKTALTSIIEKYNQSGRFNPQEGEQFPSDPDSLFDPTPIEWTFAKYKRFGFEISTTDITVTNSDSDKDILIKDKLHDVYKSENFAFKDFYPSKYLENPADDNAIIEVDNSLNYFLITGATKPASAKFEQFNDIDGIYKNMYYSYNENVYKIDDLYNEEDLLNINQIRAFILEMVSKETTSLVPTQISEALTSFVNPIYTRYQSELTQQLISINYIADGENENLKFDDQANLEHYITLQQIAERAADNYVEYETEEASLKYNNFHNWNEEVLKLVNGGNK